MGWHWFSHQLDQHFSAVYGRPEFWWSDGTSQNLSRHRNRGPWWVSPDVWKIYVAICDAVWSHLYGVSETKPKRNGGRKKQKQMGGVGVKTRKIQRNFFWVAYFGGEVKMSGFKRPLTLRCWFIDFCWKTFKFNFEGYSSLTNNWKIAIVVYVFLLVVQINSENLHIVELVGRSI